MVKFHIILHMIFKLRSGKLCFSWDKTLPSASLTALSPLHVSDPSHKPLKWERNTRDLHSQLQTTLWCLSPAQRLNCQIQNGPHHPQHTFCVTISLHSSLIRLISIRTSNLGSLPVMSFKFMAQVTINIHLHQKCAERSQTHSFPSLSLRFPTPIGCISF